MKSIDRILFVIRIINNNGFDKGLSRIESNREIRDELLCKGLLRIEDYNRKDIRYSIREVSNQKWN